MSRRSLRFDSRSTGLFVNSSAPQSADESLKLFLQLTHFPFRPGQSLTTHLSTFTHRCTPKHAAIRCANQQQQTTLGHNNNKRSTYNTSNRADPRPLPLSLSLCVFMIVSPPSKNKKCFQTRGAGGESVLLCLSEPGGRHHVKHRGGPLYTPVKLY